MLIAFFIISIFVGIVSSICWSSNGTGNVLLKSLMIIYTLYAVLMLLGYITPLINNGTLRVL